MPNPQTQTETTPEEIARAITSMKDALSIVKLLIDKTKQEKEITPEGEKMEHRFFIDLDCEANLTDGLPYYATGLIEGGPWARPPNVSGKDYAVTYINPWGEFQREWRAVSEIRIIEVDEENYMALKEALALKERDK